MDVAVTGWYLEYRQAASNSYKFYTVLIADNGVTVTHWGRIGSAGQAKIEKLPTLENADDLGKRQLYAKKSKGYATVHENVKFAVDEATIMSACESGDGRILSQLFHRAVSEPQFQGDKVAVSQHYDDFVRKAQSLLTESAGRPFDAVVAEFQELQDAWAEIDAKHAEARITVDMTQQMLTQRIMTGSL